MDRCINTTFLIGPISGSIFFRDCKNCKISVACQQFRCRDLYDSVVYLYAANDPVIESSSNLTFAPFNLAYPGLKEHAAKAKLNTEVNKWDMIFDFTLNAKGDLNFQVMDPKEWEVKSKPIEGLGEPEITFAYPARYGGTIPDDMKFVSSAEDNHFGFDHSAAQAEQIMKQKEKQPEQIQEEVQQPGQIEA